MTAREMQIAFTTDKNGRPVAYRYSHGAMRWIRIGMDDAKIRVATGAAREVRYCGPATCR